jgi:hypothetical protein
MIKADGIPTIDEAIGPKIGVYHDMPADQYHAIDLPSNSILTMLKESPLEARYAKDNSPDDEDEDLLFGRALHTACLEPEKFASTYLVAGRCEAFKKGDGARCSNDGKIRSSGKWFCGVHGRGLEVDPTITVLTDSQATAIKGMKERIETHPITSRLLKVARQTEVTVIFRDPQTDIMAKMRADWLVNGVNARWVVDIKSTRDSGSQRFASAIYNYGYCRQGAMYLRGLASHGMLYEAFVIIAVKKTAPYKIGVYKISDKALESGDQEITDLLLLYDECERSGKWPDSPKGDRIEEITLTAWEFNRIEKSLTEKGEQE